MRNANMLAWTILVILIVCASKTVLADQNVFFLVDSLKIHDSLFDGQQHTVNEKNSLRQTSEFVSMSMLENAKSTGKRFAEIGGCSDDSLFYVSYSNGLVLLEHIGVTYFLVGSFPQTANGLRPGQPLKEVRAKLGIPFRENTNMLTYKCLDEFLLKEQGTREEYEAVRLYFRNDKLIAIQILSRGTC